MKFLLIILGLISILSGVCVGFYIDKKSKKISGCTNNGECPKNQVCVDGKCIDKPCNGWEDCTDNKDCIDGKCVDIPMAKGYTWQGNVSQVLTSKSAIDCMKKCEQIKDCKNWSYSDGSCVIIDKPVCATENKAYISDISAADSKCKSGGKCPLPVLDEIFEDIIGKQPCEQDGECEKHGTSKGICENGYCKWECINDNMCKTSTNDPWKCIDGKCLIPCSDDLCGGKCVDSKTCRRLSVYSFSCNPQGIVPDVNIMDNLSISSCKNLQEKDKCTLVFPRSGNISEIDVPGTCKMKDVLRCVPDQICYLSKDSSMENPYGECVSSDII